MSLWSDFLRRLMLTATLSGAGAAGTADDGSPADAPPDTPGATNDADALPTLPTGVERGAVMEARPSLG